MRNLWEEPMSRKLILEGHIVQIRNRTYTSKIPTGINTVTEANECEGGRGPRTATRISSTRRSRTVELGRCQPHPHSSSRLAISHKIQNDCPKFRHYLKNTADPWRWLNLLHAPADELPNKAQAWLLRGHIRLVRCKRISQCCHSYRTAASQVYDQSRADFASSILIIEC